MQCEMYSTNKISIDTVYEHNSTHILLPHEDRKAHEAHA